MHYELSQISEVSFYWDAAVFVFVVFVEVYPMTEGVHRGLGGVLQGVSILQTAYNDRRKDVSRSRELDWGRDPTDPIPTFPREGGGVYYFVWEEEVFGRKMVVAYDSRFSINDATGDEDGHRTDAPQLVYKSFGLIPCDTLMTIFHTRQQTGLSIIWETQMGCRQHLTHTTYRTLIGTCVHLTIVAHNRINIYLRTQRGLLTTIVSHQLRLTFGCHKTCYYSIKAEAQLIPLGHRLLDVVGALENGKLSIGEGIGDEHSRQVKHIMAHIREYGHLTCCCYLAVAAHITNEKYFAFYHAAKVNKKMSKVKSQRSKVINKLKNRKKNSFSFWFSLIFFIFVPVW